MSNHYSELPGKLLVALRLGTASPSYLQWELPDAWLYNDAPVGLITADEWIELFAAAGFFSMQWAPGRSYDLPVEPKKFYRGATQGRARGMSWCTTLEMARAFQIGAGARSRLPAYIYQAIIPPEGILAILQRPGDGGAEFVVRPEAITDIAVVGEDAPPVSDVFTLT